MVRKDTKKPFVQQDDFYNRATTHDILQLDKFYCSVEGVMLNKDLVSKYNMWCGSTDRLGHNRKFFLHNRACDGMKDCSNGWDESSTFCKEAQP